MSAVLTGINANRRSRRHADALRALRKGAVYIKDILVHVDLSPACDERVRLAMRLAKRFRANLIGAFVLPSLEMVAPPESGAAAIAVVTWLAELEEAAASWDNNSWQRYGMRELMAPGLRNMDLRGFRLRAWHA
jgi:hypothetical protein